MLRRTKIAVSAGAVTAVSALLLLAATTSADTLSSCSISGVAHFSPGLTVSPHTVSYTFTGNIGTKQHPCHSSDKTLKYTTKLTASGKGSKLTCTSGSSTGTAHVTWNDGKTSTIQFKETTDPPPAAPGHVTVTSTSITGTAFAGDHSVSHLAFSPPPQQCAVGGVKSAPFTGTTTDTN